MFTASEEYHRRIKSTEELTFQHFPGYSDPSSICHGTQTIGEIPFSDQPYASHTDHENYNFDDEPPLLEELGVDLKVIFRKTLCTVTGIEDPEIIENTDLAGPFFFCVLLGVLLFISGSKANFGYVYGMAVSSCGLMYILLNLMSPVKPVELCSVGSTLGYSLLPIITLVLLSSLFYNIRLIVGILMVIYSSYCASKHFAFILGKSDQKLLIAYPCALVYGTFALVIMF